jgi:hypothetical protein
MTIGADQYTFAGVDLFGEFIRTRTVTGQWQTPPLVGGGVKLLNVPGERFLKKIHGARKISLELLLLTDPDFIDPSTGAPDRLTVYNNLDLLSGIFNIQFEENDLVWHHPDGIDRSAKAHGVGFNPADVSHIGELYVGTVDFLMSDPYFYRPVQTVNDGGTGAFSIDNPGTVRSHRLQFTIANPTNPTEIVNTSNGMTLTLSAAGALGFIDVFTWVATVDSVNKIGVLSHSGDIPFMQIDPDVNNFTITGAGSVTMTWYPAFI